MPGSANNSPPLTMPHHVPPAAVHASGELRTPYAPTLHPGQLVDTSHNGRADALLVDTVGDGRADTIVHLSSRRDAAERRADAAATAAAAAADMYDRVSYEYSASASGLHSSGAARDSGASLAGHGRGRASFGVQEDVLRDGEISSELSELRGWLDANRGDSCGEAPPRRAGSVAGSGGKSTGGGFRQTTYCPATPSPGMHNSPTVHAS